MIHPSHSRKDLLEVIKVFNLTIKNSDDLNKNELSRMLWIKISNTEMIDPDNNYFFINNIQELFRMRLVDLIFKTISKILMN